MKIIFENIRKNYIVKIAFIIFIIQSIFSFYNSIKLDSIDLLISGVVDHFFWFLVLYALGLIALKERK